MKTSSSIPPHPPSGHPLPAARGDLGQVATARAPAVLGAGEGAVKMRLLGAFQGLRDLWDRSGAPP